MKLPSARFHFILTAYGGNHLELRLHGKELWVINADMPFPLPEPGIKIPLQDNAAWKSVLAWLNQCTWQGQYWNNEILDGQQWELEYRTASVSIEASGSNEYPADFGEFLAVLNTLTGPHGICIEADDIM